MEVEILILEEILVSKDREKIGDYSDWLRGKAAGRRIQSQIQRFV